jgi:hypothetical protein
MLYGTNIGWHASFETMEAHLIATGADYMLGYCMLGSRLCYVSWHRVIDTE